MSHVGILCPHSPGHLNPMVALADAMRSRGHRVTFFLVTDKPPEAVLRAGFESVPLGGTIFPEEEYAEAIRELGALNGRAALKHTIGIGVRATSAILANGPAALRSAGVDALVADQVSSPGGTVADELGMPFATVCNALMLNRDPIAPPFFTLWRPRTGWFARLRNNIAWSGLERMLTPILDRVRDRRRQLGLSLPKRLADTNSDRLQISQQPEAFEFPRRELPPQFRFVGPLRLPGGYPPVDFPWDRLDGRPLIYASFGTLQNRVAATFRLIAEACAGTDSQLVITTGNGVAPAELADLPGGPVVVSYAPQLDLLKRAALAVTHAGLNTALDSLSCGLPMVAVPVTNEQPGIAARIVWTGAGEAIPLKRLTARRLRAAIIQVRDRPSYRASAERVRESIRAGGGAPRAAELIETALGLGAAR